MGLHASIDIETLDLEPTAVVLSIGVALFTEDGEIVDTFYRVLDKDSQKDAGRTVRKSTLEWWEQQGDAARRVLTADGAPVSQVIAELATFLSRPLSGVWGYGSDFDNVTVSSLCRSFGLDVPWHYKLNRCGRTVAALPPPGSFVSPQRVGVHHNAVDDAIYQARLIARALQALAP